MTLSATEVIAGFDSSVFIGVDGRDPNEESRQIEKTAVKNVIKMLQRYFPWCVEIIEVQNNSQLDGEGIDLIVILNERAAWLLGIKCLLIQVKSHNHGVSRYFNPKTKEMCSGVMFFNGTKDIHFNIVSFFQQLVQLVPESHKENFAKFFWTEHSNIALFWMICRFFTDLPLFLKGQLVAAIFRREKRNSIKKCGDFSGQVRTTNLKDFLEYEARLVENLGK